MDLISSLENQYHRYQQISIEFRNIQKQIHQYVYQVFQEVDTTKTGSIHVGELLRMLKVTENSAFGHKYISFTNKFQNLTSEERDGMVTIAESLQMLYELANVPYNLKEFEITEYQSELKARLDNCKCNKDMKCRSTQTCDRINYCSLN